MANASEYEQNNSIGKTFRSTTGGFTRTASARATSGAAARTAAGGPAHRTSGAAAHSSISNTAHHAADDSAINSAAHAVLKATENLPRTFAYVGHSSTGKHDSMRFDAAMGKYDAGNYVGTNLSMPAHEILVPDAHGGAEHRVYVYDPGVIQFAARLRKVFKQRSKWAKRENIWSYRLYDADLPEYAVVIDIYNAITRKELLDGSLTPSMFVYVAEYQAPKTVDEIRAAQRYVDVMTVIPCALGIKAWQVFSKVRRQAKGGSQYAMQGDGRNVQRRSPFVCYTRENGHYFELDLNSYLDTGLFLDHRDTRLMIEKLSSGKRVLNLFAYTGSASVYAAAGGATSVTTVDLSQTYLDWAARNMKMNRFTRPDHTFERADVMDFLHEAIRQKRRWDLVFVDPPTFSNSKSMGSRTWDVQRDYLEMLKLVKRVCAPNATIIFSNNLRSFKTHPMALQEAGIYMDDISERTIPEDFERNPKIHKCYRIYL